jgi:integrase
VVKVRRYRGSPDKWEIDIRFRWPDGSLYRERRRATVTSKSGALREGQRREVHLLATGKAAPAPSAPAPRTAPVPVPVSVAAPVPAPKSDVETCDQWHERYLTYCIERGISTTRDKRYRWRKWVSPTISRKPPAEVTRDDVEAIRDKLDGGIRDGSIRRWKTAHNAWGELTVALGEMVSSKRKDLKVLSVDPSNGVQPPERGSELSKVYPYPSEFHALLSCQAVPLEWREVYAIAAYTYLRPGELWVLEWSDIDLDDQTLHITKAWDFKNRKTKATKTKETRHPPIELTLLPLLRAMHERANGKGLVVPLLSRTDPNALPDLFREHLITAKCTRPRLYRQSAAERRVVFRSLRDAGITWSIVRGDDIVRVQRRAGHKLIGTTQRYIVEAENRGATFGTPFASLPAALVGSAQRFGETVEKEASP